MISGDIQKINGDFQYTNKLQEYAINPVWAEDYASTWRLLSGATNDIGSTIQEHIANYVQNIKDIDTCELHNLYSIATELDVEQIFSYDLTYPTDLEQDMNILSTNRSFTLTTGYMLTDESLKELYSDIGVAVTGGLSGELSATIILDVDYISGFLEPYLKKNLEEGATFLGSGNYDTPILEEIAYKRSLEYQGFMDDVYSDPQSPWDSTTSAVIIDEVTHTLRNICIRASYQRETLKTIAQKHAMIGSTHAIEKLISEYILRSYTKKEDWRLYVEPSGLSKTNDINNLYALEQSLPHIKSINDKFSVDVIEYWDTTEYMNISAASPYVRGITGYTTVIETTSYLDLSGNIVTGTVSAEVPVYGEGLCGYVVTGGNARYWEGESLATSILMSEHTSGEVREFYENVGLSPELSTSFEFQKYLWDMYATSGLNRLAVIPELTGVRTPEYSATAPSAVPASGWLVPQTSLSDMHWKYMGVVSGDMPPANIKNQLYPTIAPQPFIWNLVEKVFDDFPNILRTLLFSEQSTAKNLSAQIDASGNLVDSWKYFNHEYIGYQTAYEEANNLDFNENMNIDIDRDGPFSYDALSALIYNGDLFEQYNHIKKDFALSATMPRIDHQLEAFSGDIVDLKEKVVYSYSFDSFDNHYALYKPEDELTTFGRMWLRYRNHPLSFPMSYGNKDQYELQQMYVRGNGIYDLGYIVEGHTYDFGFYDDVCWILGRDTNGNDRLIVFTVDYIKDIVPNETLFSIKVDNTSIPAAVDIGSINNYVGSYLDNNYIVFVYIDQWLDDHSVSVFFKHYDRYSYKFNNSLPQNHRVISGLPSRQITPNEYSNVWRLATSEELVTLAYEALNTKGDSEYVNSIVTIDLMKSTLDTSPSKIAIMEFYHYLENM